MAKKREKKHSEFIAEWIRNTKTPAEARKILGTKVSIYGEKVFSFDKKKDDLFMVANAGDNKAFKVLIMLLGGINFLKEHPEYDIFEKGHEDNWYNDRLDSDKLDDFHDKYKKQYLDAFNVLVVYEYQMMGRTTSSYPIYIIDFNKRRIIQLEYEEASEGDDQWLDLDTSAIQMF